MKVKKVKTFFLKIIKETLNFQYNFNNWISRWQFTAHLWSSRKSFSFTSFPTPLTFHCVHFEPSTTSLFKFGFSLEIFFLKLSNFNVMFTSTVKISSFHGLELYYFTFTTFYPFKRETLKKAFWTFCFFHVLPRSTINGSVVFDIILLFFLRKTVKTINIL